MHYSQTYHAVRLLPGTSSIVFVLIVDKSETSGTLVLTENI